MTNCRLHFHVFFLFQVKLLRNTYPGQEFLSVLETINILYWCRER